MNITKNIEDDWKLLCENYGVLRGDTWFFHNDFRIMAALDKRLQKHTDLEFRNFIIWNKLFSGSNREGFLKGFVQVEGLKKFQKISEYLLFYTRKDLHKKLRIERLNAAVYPLTDRVNQGEIVSGSSFRQKKSTRSKFGQRA